MGENLKLKKSLDCSGAWLVKMAWSATSIRISGRKASPAVFLASARGKFQQSLRPKNSLEFRRNVTPGRVPEPGTHNAAARTAPKNAPTDKSSGA